MVSWLCCGAPPVQEREVRGHHASVVEGKNGQLGPRKLQPGATKLPPLHAITTSAQGSGIDSITDRGMDSVAEASLQDALTQVTLILRSLRELEGSPIEQLEGTCRLLADVLADPGLVSVSMLVEGSQPVSVCIAAAGDFVNSAKVGFPMALTLIDGLDNNSMPARESSVERVICTQEGYMKVITPEEIKFGASPANETPSDWLDMYHSLGLSAYAAVPVIRGNKAVGVLSLASSSAHLWAASSVLGLMSAVSVWISSSFDAPQLARLPSLLASTLLASDVEMMVQSLAAGLQDHFKAYKGFKLHARIALLSGTASAVVYEQQAAAPPRSTLRIQPDRPSDANTLTSRTSGCNQDVRAKLNAIRKSTAVSSLQDFRSLASAISAHDENRHMFARQSASLGMGSAVFGTSPNQRSGVSFSQFPPSSKGHNNNSVPQLLTPFGSGRLVGGSHDSPQFLSAGMHPEASDRSRTGLAGGSGHGVSTPGLSTQALHIYNKAASSSLARPMSTMSLYEMPTHQNTFSGKLEHMAMTEDVLLRMVHEVDDLSQGPMELVAHAMSLDKTLLEWVVGQGGHQRGTWIFDIATYMMQPNRAGKDIVLTSSSPALASLAVACMPSTMPGSVRATDKYSSLGSMNLDLGHTPGPLDRSDASHALDPPVMAIYLTSPTTLSPRQCHEVLKELHSVLGLLSTPLTLKLRTSLQPSLSALFSNMLDEADFPSITSSITAPPSPALVRGQKVGTPAGTRSKTASILVSPYKKSHSGLGPNNNPLLAHMARAHGTDPGPPLDSGPGLSGSVPWSNSSMPRNCSMTWYSKEPLKPQVAPLVAGLQDRLRGLLAESVDINCFNRHEDLPSVRAEVLVAHGGFGNVFQGSWQGLEVAIKVVPQRTDTTDSVREAVELAVMSTVSHPNILGVQNYWTDVLVTGGPLLPGERRPNGLLKLDSAIEKEREALSPSNPSMMASYSTNNVLSPRLSVGSRLQSPSGAAGTAALEKQEQEAKRSLVIIMELCDHGSLDDAIQRGAFRIQPPGQRSPRLHMLAVLTTLLEIAMALRHMHSMQLVHCDLKPGNVLLKSSMSDIRQFTTKLCDFGLVKIRQEGLSDLTETIRRSTFTGTVTHSPPEMLKGDPNPAFSYDIFAFGIIMWELTSNIPVYAGLSDRQVAQQVVYNNLRPEFPKHFDLQYKELACACWAAEPVHRPTSDQVVQKIGSMLMALRSRAQGMTDVAAAVTQANAAGGLASPAGGLQQDHKASGKASPRN